MLACQLYKRTHHRSLGVEGCPSVKVQQLCHGLFVHTMMKQGRDYVVTKGVQMERLGETILLENLPQMFCERVWVDEISIFIGE